jgi:hypothetical protein
MAMRTTFVRVAAAIMLGLCACSRVSAATITFGTLSFEEGFPGVTSLFRVWNVIDSIALIDADQIALFSLSSLSLKLNPESYSAQFADPIEIASLAAGELSDTDESTLSFASARLRGTVSVPASFLILEGDTLFTFTPTLSSFEFDVTLEPPVAGSILEAGNTVEILLQGDKTEAPTGLPEPASLLFVLTGVGLTAIGHRWLRASGC